MSRDTAHKPWVSTDFMRVRHDETLSFPDGLFSPHIAESIVPFVATTPLGPKNIEWDVAGLYIPSDQSNKIMLCTHGHGSCCTSLVWAKFFSPLVEAGFSVISFDAPCFGRSSGKATGQANLWRSNDHMLILRLLQCFRAQPGSVYSMAQCMGAAMLFRAMSAEPELFAHRFVTHNATIGIWPENMDHILKTKGGQIMGWHEYDPDHMREAVCYKNLKRLSGLGLSIFTDSAMERLNGNEHLVLEKGAVHAPHLSRDRSLFLFTPSSEICQKIIQFFLSSPQLPRHGGDTIWSPPEITAVQMRATVANSSTQPVDSVTPKIKVCIRVRPFLADEEDRFLRPIYHVDETPHGLPVISFQRREKRMSYVFDHIFSSSYHSPNAHSVGKVEDVFLPVRTLVDGVKEGSCHATVLAYGQTAAGKTYTVSEIVEYVSHELMQDGNIVTVQYSQIYNDRTFDLLEHNKPCSGPAALSVHTVRCEKDLLDCYDSGNYARTTASTAMNVTSSRSHAILTLTLKNTGRKISLVDLAGSERVKRTFSTGSTFKEATEINSSLLVLSRVLRAKITPGNSHIPYRDSALTLALEEMLESPNHRAVMFACISPCADSVYESDQTLRFASNATYVPQPSSKLKSSASMNEEDTKTGDLSHFRDAAFASKGSFGGSGECMVPASDEFPWRLHCLGRDAGNINVDSGCDDKVSVETVVLLHYYGGSCFELGAAMWKENINQFPPHMRVIALSFSGHGLSEGTPPRSSPEEDRFMEPKGAVEQVLRVLDYFGVAKAHIVGYDYGGGVAMQMALSIPRRVMSLVAWNPSYRISPAQEASQKKRKWIQRSHLIATPSVWMPEKKTTGLQSFMQTKVVRCRRERDVWDKIFKKLLC